MEAGPRETAAGSSLAGQVGGVPERFVPAEMRGELVEAEHLARYRWITQLAPGKRVLDAACGTGYGCDILTSSGASEVTGVDLDEAAVASARRAAPRARIEQADVRKLPFDENAFDLAVSFETIEHLEDPEPLLDELARVLAPEGLLAVSSPNRDASAGGNPHHLRELRPAELREALERRFANVMLLRQHGWYATAVLRDEAFGTEDIDVGEVGVRKIGLTTPGEETYTIALASDGALPDFRQLVALSEGLDQRRLIEAWREVNGELGSLRGRIAELEGASEERDELRQQLTAAEQAAAQVLELRAREDELMRIRSSLSWRITRPLRILEARLRHSAPRWYVQARRLAKRVLLRIRG
jgi:SAM-dependent methyltransferase